MKRWVLHFSTLIATFGFGLILVALIESPQSTSTAIENEPQKFEVYLKPIDVRSSDKDQRNINGGYLNVFDAVYLDDQTILALYSQDGMRLSHDNGQTWQRLFTESGGLPPETKGFTLWDLDFPDSKHGWAGGSILIKTDDGGHTWQNVKIPEWIDNIQVKFLNDEVGFVAGRGGSCERGSGECSLWLSVYKTVDGGRTWKRVFKTHEGDTPWQIEIADIDKVMITFGGGWMIRTEDGGRNWKFVLDRMFGKVMSISRAPDGRYWIFGTCSVLTSDDLGKRWQKQESVPKDVLHHEWWSVDFDDNGLGIAVSEDAAIAITRDSGRTWKLAESNLHRKGEIPVENDPFSECLRGISLHGNKGIVKGSQRDYWIDVPN